MSGLFQLGDFTLASGQKSRWKIECDALTDAGWECIAYLAAQITPDFGVVIGVPTGGLPFARAMQKYVSPASLTRLVVDDVLTTGNSMKAMMQPGDFGLVAFARRPLPAGIGAVFIFSGAL